MAGPRKSGLEGVSDEGSEDQLQTNPDQRILPPFLLPLLGFVFFFLCFFFFFSAIWNEGASAM